MIVTDRRTQLLYLVCAALLVGVFGWLDIVTGYELNFSLFYLAPIAIAAWVGGAVPGLIFSIVSAVIWGSADVLSGHQYSSQIYYFWNSLIRFGFFVIVSLLLAEVRRAHTREAAFARTDALTGLANSRNFYEAVDLELSRCRRYKRPFSLAYIDLDDFKGVNDTAGHTAGDALLVAMASALRQQVRDVDTVARLGGDEFAVLLPETDAQGATAAAREMHQALEAAATQLGHRVGASIGVVTCLTPPRDRDELLHLADELMYSVKRGTKNAVACSVYVQEVATAR